MMSFSEELDQCFEESLVCQNADVFISVTWIIYV